MRPHLLLLLLLTLAPVAPPRPAAPAFLSALSRGGPPFDATVQAVLPAGPYRYVDLGMEGWAVTLSAVQPGDAVRVRPFGEQTNFWSRRLQWRFDRLRFAHLTPSPD